MATKDQLYQIIAAYGLGRTLPSGSTRSAARTAVNGIVKAGKIVVPAASKAGARAAPSIGRAALGVARRNPYVATGAGLLALQQAGLLDPIIDPIAETVEEEVVIPIQKSGRRNKTKFNKAVSKGMSAVKMSKFYGKKGTINNAKRAFGAVTKVASKVNAGKKVSAKGVTGTIKRAIKGIL